LHQNGGSEPFRSSIRDKNQYKGKSTFVEISKDEGAAFRQHS